MAGTDTSGNASLETSEPGTIDMGLEVVTLPVADVDRAKSSEEITTRLPGREWDD